MVESCAMAWLGVLLNFFFISLKEKGSYLLSVVQWFYDDALEFLIRLLSVAQ